MIISYIQKMNINPLNQRNNLDSNNIKLKNSYDQLQQLLISIAQKELPETVIEKLNHAIDTLNAIDDSNPSLHKAIKNTQASLLKILDKELKVVPINHYKKLWMVLGMSAFGMPLGVAFGISIGNLGLLGLGFPIGMAIGVFVGISQDKKALAEGRQLAFEAKY